MAEPMYDVEQFATHLGNALQFLADPADKNTQTQTGDVISQVGQGNQSMTASQGNPLGGMFGGGAYDGFGVTQEYGVNGHPGMDIGTPVGTPILAPFQGTVTHASNDDPGGYGSWIEVTGADGTVVRYGHLSGMNVKQGQSVGPGTSLGFTGGAQGGEGSGNSSGPHLHFEVRQGGTTIDPSTFLAGGWQVLGSRG